MVRFRRKPKSIGEPVCGNRSYHLTLIVCSTLTLLFIAWSHAIGQSLTDNVPLTTVLFGRSIVPTIQLTSPFSLSGQITYTDPVTTTVLRHPGEFRWWLAWEGHPFALRLGVGFSGGETGDLSRLVLDQPAGQGYVPNELQLGIRIPF